MSDGASIRCGGEVAAALRSGAPIVALESTILAHGFPHPDNRQLAEELEVAIRQEGAVPATIAVMDGRLRAGLEPHELDRLTDPDAAVAKAGMIDLAVHIARGEVAATTVSATLYAAAALGIRFFATGGIGGVHRGDAGDVSSDLAALARQPVAVVSAGAKAILDLPRTVERLETLGVLVLGYRTFELPAFYVRGSGVPLTHRVESPVEIAELCRTRFDGLGQGGVLICNPIPEEHALDPGEIDAAIEAALGAADDHGIAGKELTPFLLARVAEATGGRAVAANRELALSNARLAARAAVAYAGTPHDD